MPTSLNERKKSNFCHTRDTEYPGVGSVALRTESVVLTRHTQPSSSSIVSTLYRRGCLRTTALSLTTSNVYHQITHSFAFFLLCLSTVSTHHARGSASKAVCFMPGTTTSLYLFCPTELHSNKPVVQRMSHLHLPRKCVNKRQWKQR